MCTRKLFVFRRITLFLYVCNLLEPFIDKNNLLTEQADRVISGLTEVRECIGLVTM